MLIALLTLYACLPDYERCTAELEGCFEVEGGRYLAVEPDGGVAENAPVMVYFHGYSSSASNQLNKPWLKDDLKPSGYLTIFPDGHHNTWSHEESPSNYRDELPFLDAVLNDVAARWSIDPSRIFTSGFSQGGSMAWYLACDRGEQIAGLVPAAGSFWEPLPESCGEPVPIRHTHGLSDSIFPLEGRAIGHYSHQGDTWEGLAIWREINGCGEYPDREELEGETTCQIWDSCSGAEIRVCLHEGGHSIPDDWMAQNLEWMQALR